MTYDEDAGKYGRNVWGIRQLDDKTFYWNEMDKIDVDITEVLEEGDIVVVDGVPYTLFADEEPNDRFFNGQLYIIRMSEDHMPRFTAVSYLSEHNQIEAVLTKEQLKRESFKITS